MKPIKDMDYVELYAEKLKNDNSLFKQHKIFVESQLQGSQSLFKNTFGEGDNFKTLARSYLRKIGLISPLLP